MSLLRPNYVKINEFYLSDLSNLSFFFKKGLFSKNNIYNYTLRSSFNVNKLKILKITQRKMWTFFKYYLLLKNQRLEVLNFKDLQLGRIIFFDMINLYKAWRHIKGYPVRGQRTWSNGKSCTKNNSTLKSFRLQQFYKEFGTKKRTNFNVLLNAEYNNKLWQKSWVSEWHRAKTYCLRTRNRKTNTITVDIVSLSKGITTGYIRRGQASKYNKGKKALKMVTLGLPIFFSKYFFANGDLKKFPYKIVATQEEKKPQKRRKKSKKKK